MKEELIKVLNENGYTLPKEVTFREVLEIVQHYQNVITMLEERHIFIPVKKKSLDI